MDDSIRDLIFQTIDQTISDHDFERLQDAIERDTDARREYLRAVGLCESLADLAVESSMAGSSDSDASVDLANGGARKGSGVFFGETVLASPEPQRRKRLPTPSASQYAIAALVLLLVAGTAFWMGRRDSKPGAEQIATDERATDQQSELRIAGHATLRRAVDVRWVGNSVRRLEGDVLAHGELAFDAGVAEIDFFCGATLIVEGPASLDIESDWSVRVMRGRLRAIVPDAARGFVVKAAGSEIVDLGTEFALEVGAENASVEVIDGEVELRGGDHDGTHLLTGESQSLKGEKPPTRLAADISTVSDVQQRRQAAEQRRFSNWKTHSQKLQEDERLIAYYPIAASQAGRVVLNASSAGRDRDGLLVGPVDRVAGRFGGQSSGLEFDRPGARVRTRIDGQFSAFTFACWVRIDSLPHRYNALFMADSYETGEPHWQIRDDGSLMFSVMVDDTQEIQHFSKYEQRMVTHAGLHRVYYTEPFWDGSKSGQWFHLAAIYDPANRQVTQYVNGKQIAREEIVDRFHISTLALGPSEIGNWGQPFRKTPWFAVRNLNGTIDELAIFNAALTADDIHNFYEQGKPLGY